MKKNYFMLALASMMMAACANNDLVDDLVKEEVPQAIGFETFAQKATRVTSASTDLATHHDKYYVWGYKNTDNTNLVFSAQGVTASNNSYSPTKYWDKAASTYYFYATAPNGFTFVGDPANQDAAYFTLANLEMKCTNFTTSASTTAKTALKKESGDIDYMISTTTAKNNDANAINKFYNPVDFNFKHILSRLNVTVKDNDANTSNVKLNFVDVYGLITKASFTSNSDVMDTRWSKSSTTNKYTSLAVDEVSYVPSGATYVLECLVIPQTVEYEAVNLDGTGTKTKPYVHVQYVMQGETFNAYYNLAALFGADGTDKTSVNLSEAQQNTLNIIFNPAGIEFSTSTTAWTSGTGSTTIN